MAFAQRQAPSDIAEMNITPLIDVMLVLLVIFMIAAPILSRPIPLDLPGRADRFDQPEPAKPLTLRIDAVGDLFVDGRPMPLSALPSVLEAEHVRIGAQVLPLQMDVNGQADYQTVAQVIAAAKNAGLDNIRFL
jgi:biopolymer transport protein ExbD